MILLYFSGAIQDSAAPPKVRIYHNPFDPSWTRFVLVDIQVNCWIQPLKTQKRLVLAETSEFLCYSQPSRPGIQPSFVQIPTSAAQSTFDSSRGVTSPRGGWLVCLVINSPYSYSRQGTGIYLCFNDINPQKPRLKTSSSPLPGIQLWSIRFQYKSTGYATSLSIP